MAQVTYDGTNFEEVLGALNAVKGGIKFSDHDEPGSPPNISVELADGTLVDINVGDVVTAVATGQTALIETVEVPPDATAG